jgi:uncharacterized protein YndB with AHSA1/START domain
MPLRFTTEVVLERSIGEVWRAFDSPANLKRWQPTLESFEPVSGTPGQPGAVSRLTYQEGKRTVVLTETVSERREPGYFAGAYDSGMALNRIANHFVAVDAGRTQWRMECEFVFRGFWRLLAPLFRRAIEQRTREDIERFKQCLESGTLD